MEATEWTSGTPILAAFREKAGMPRPEERG